METDDTYSKTYIGPRETRSLPLNNNRLANITLGQESVYTILIRLPPDSTSIEESTSIRMIHDDVPLAQTHPPRRPLSSRDSDLGDVKLNLDG